METRDPDSSCNQRKLVSELTTSIIFSFVHKNYCYIVILFLCHVFPFASKDFVFPLLLWSILGFKLERTFLKKKNPKDFWKYFVSDGQMEFSPKHNCTFIWCSYQFNTRFCVILQLSLVKKRNFMSKGKTILQSSCIIFFRILCRMDIFFKMLIIYQNAITMKISNM